jgi:predicted metal-binding protein
VLIDGRDRKWDKHMVVVEECMSNCSRALTVGLFPLLKISFAFIYLACFMVVVLASVNHIVSHFMD